jgi:hypothetical protein
MKVKLLFAGGGATIPKVNIPAGAGFLSVWIDDAGYQSATNSIGSTFYVLLETKQVDIGEVSEDLNNAFTNLNAAVVHWTIAPNVFVYNGGIANVTMAVQVQQSGTVIEKKIQFVATDCTGVAVSSAPLDFTCQMAEIDQSLALADQIVPDDAVSQAVAAAPQDDSNAAVA